MLFSTDVKNATSLDLLAVLVGSKRNAAALLRNSGGSLFSLLHQEPGHQRGALCAQEGLALIWWALLDSNQRPKDSGLREFLRSLDYLITFGNAVKVSGALGGH